MWSYDGDKKYFTHQYGSFNVYDDNKIGASGGSVIGEGLKVNSTLTALNLSMRS